MIDFTDTLDRLEIWAEHVPWPQISKTRFFHWVTTTADPSATPSTFPSSLFPHRHLYTVSAPLFTFVFLASVMGLYGLLLVNTRPFSRPSSRPISTRTKQWIAFPLWCVLVGWPLLVRCESTLVHMGVALFSTWTGQRTLDLYFVQPWSGVGEMRRESYRAYLALETKETKEAKEAKEAKEVKVVQEKKNDDDEKGEKGETRKGLESIEGNQVSDSEKEHGIRRRSVRLQLVRAKKSPRAVTVPALSPAPALAPAVATTTAATPARLQSMIKEENRPLQQQELQTPGLILDQGRRTRRKSADTTVLNWDWDRFMIELWLPMRKFSRSSLLSSLSPSPVKSSSSLGPSKRFILGSDLLWTVIVYKFLIDWFVYRLSFISLDWTASFGPVRYGVLVTATGALVMLMTLWPVRFTAWIYHYRYRHLSGYQKLDVEEWPMLGRPLPCFATHPLQFWLYWHTILRYIWVDLGFLPTQKLCRRVLTKERVGRTMARMAEEALPVMAVFTLSGLLHAYVVMAVWRESGWSQMAYFWIQGGAVVLTKALERSRMVGGRIRRIRGQGGSKGKAFRIILDGVGWTLMMAGWHLATVPLFVEPYLKNGMWLPIKELSPVWWIITKTVS